MHLAHVGQYSFLWNDDLRGNYEEFMHAEPSLVVVSREVERLLKIEKNVLAIPTELSVGAICLQMQWVKDALHGFALTWKNLYASVLHEEAKVGSFHILNNFVSDFDSTHFPVELDNHMANILHIIVTNLLMNVKFSC